MTRRVLTTLIVVVLALAASACGSNTESPQPPQEVKVTTTSMSTTTTRVPVTTSSTTVAPTTTTSTTTPTTTTAQAVASDCPDIDGQVLRKLASLKFFDINVDGCDSLAIADVLAAFQKFNRLEITGVFTPELAQAILAAPLTVTDHASEPNSIVIELDRQLLFLYEGGELVRVQHVSTGDANLMPTPKGDFNIFPKLIGYPIIDGHVEGSLNPMYLEGQDGVAIHGYDPVPYTRAASHGCVRVPMHIIDWLFNRVPLDEPVHVV